MLYKQISQIEAKRGDIRELAEALVEKIANEERVFSGKDKTVRYSPRTLSIANSAVDDSASSSALN